jgi:hypothetical protein
MKLTGSDHKKVAWGKTKNILKESLLLIRDGTGQVFTNHPLVGFTTSCLVFEELLEFRTTDKGSAGVNIVERLKPKEIPRTKQLALASVPKCEREVANEMLGGLNPPAFICLQNQLGIGVIAE